MKPFELDQMDEMTWSSGEMDQRGVGISKDTIKFLQKNGKYIGDQDGRRIFYVFDDLHVYGIEHEREGELSSIATFVDTQVDDKPALEFRYGYTIPESRRGNQMFRILWFIKDNQGKPIIDYGSQSNDAQKMLQNIAQTGRFEINWYNIKTRERKLYEPSIDHPKHAPFRSDETMTDWRILIEKSERPSHPTYGWDFSPWGNIWSMFEDDESKDYREGLTGEQIKEHFNKLKREVNETI